MGFRSKVSLFSECFRLAGFAGLVACAKYLSGALRLPEIELKSSGLLLGDSHG